MSEFDDLPQKPTSLRVTAKGFKAKTVPMGDVLEGLEVRLEKHDPNTARRREEIQAEILKVSMSMGEAKDDVIPLQARR